jgi:hypothetical protein
MVGHVSHARISKLEVVLGHVQTLADLCWYVGGGCCVISRYIVV